MGAIVHMPYLGMHTGTALAATLLGSTNPAARLTTTWYADLLSIGPITSYDMHPTNQTSGRTYRYHSGNVLFPFGFGLSYSRFAYAYAASTPGSFLGVVGPCARVSEHVALTLVGGAATGDEVVQLYLSIHNATVPTPKHPLVFFQRRVFGSNADVRARGSPRTQLVSFVLLPEDHAVMRGQDYQQTVQPGNRTVWVGGGQPDMGAPGVKFTFEVTGVQRTVDECAASGGAQGGSGVERWESGLSFVVATIGIKLI